MTVTFLAIGSRGDVEPLAILAGQLAASGGAATVVAVDEYAGLVRAAGASFRGLGPAMDDIARLYRTWLGRLSLRQPAAQAVLLRRWLDGLAEPLADALDEVPPGSSVVTGIAARDAALALAEDRRCSLATVLHTALLPTAHRDSHLEGHRFGPVPSVRLGLSQWYWASVSGMSQAVARAFRVRHGLPRRSERAMTRLADRHPIWLTADPVLVPTAADWPRGCRQTGAIRPSPEPEWEPPEPLRSFLDTGEPPVYVGLGSLNDARGERWLELVVAAAARSGRRVVSPALPGAAPEVVADAVCTMGPAPHDALLPRLAGMVHHGGAGTTAAGLRAGIPSTTVPAVFDQPYHGRRLAALGVGPSPVRLHRLSPDRLARLVDEVGGQHYRERAALVGEQVRAVDGIGATLAELERLGTGPAV